MKNKVIKIVEAELAGAEDNLCCANMQFHNADPESEHGQSGRNCGQIWQGYKDEVEDLKKAKSWLLSVEPLINVSRHEITVQSQVLPAHRAHTL